MKKLSRRNTLSLIIAGIFTIALAQIIQHLLPLQDVTKGTFIGIGIGFLLLAIVKGNLKSSP